VIDERIDRVRIIAIASSTSHRSRIDAIDRSRYQQSIVHSTMTIRVVRVMNDHTFGSNLDPMAKKATKKKAAPKKKGGAKKKAAKKKK